MKARGAEEKGEEVRSGEEVRRCEVGELSGRRHTLCLEFDVGSDGAQAARVIARSAILPRGCAAGCCMRRSAREVRLPFRR